MLVYNIVTAICLALMAAGISYVIIKLIFGDRTERITFIRSFKKGKGLLIYIFSLLLLWEGIVYGGGDVFYGFFDAVKRIFDIVVLKFDTAPVAALVEANPFYKFTIYFCFVLVTLNAAMFGASVLGQYLWNFVTDTAFMFSSKEKLMLFGFNDDNVTLYRSEKNRAKIIIDKMGDESAQALYMGNVIYKHAFSIEKIIKATVGYCVKDKRARVVVINTGNDDKNIELARLFVKYIAALDEEEKSACFGKLKIILFGDPLFSAVYEDIVDTGFGCITYVNEYQRIAVDFIDKYPLTTFMNDRHIDYRTSLIKDNVGINVVMVGFGRINREIFLASVANNQFVTADKNGEVVLKTVTYHLFDREEVKNEKNLNHTYFRYDGEFEKADAKKYLPLPASPATVVPHKFDLNDPRFYKTLKEIVSGGQNDVNTIVVSFGSDLENIDMAKKIIEKIKEWGVGDIPVFVRVTDSGRAGIVSDDNCYVIASKDSVYDMESVVGDRFLKMAQMRNVVYGIEYELKRSGLKYITQSKVNEIRDAALKDWYTERCRTERDSNVYCCLSLRMKLNLMGLDYCPKEDKSHKGISLMDYMNIYANNDFPDTAYYGVKADGKPVIHYPLDFKKSRRRNLAINEHYRWNSYMISRGIVPASLKEIEEEKVIRKGKEIFSNGRNYKLRHHGNLTTFDGLIKFRKMISLRDGDTEENTDVIKYDYQLLDDAYWLIDKVGCKIYKKEDVSSEK